jgi:hypothetical protein
VIDKAIEHGREMGPTSSSQGRGPRVPELTGPSREVGPDVGYSITHDDEGNQHVVRVEVPAPEPDRPKGQEIVDAKQKFIAKAIEDQSRQRTDEEARKRVVERKGLPLVRYDSPERRQAIQAHLQRLGIDPKLQAIRELYEVGQAKPPEEAVKSREMDDDSKGKGKEQEGRGKEPPTLGRW